MPPHAPIRPRLRTTDLLAPALVFGFGTTVAMWIVGFVSHLPGIVQESRAYSIAVGITMLIVMLAGAVWCGRATLGGGAPVRTAALSGGISAIVNLLILFSVLTGDDGTPHPSTYIFVTGWIALGIGIGALGGLIGSRSRDATTAPPLPPAAAGWAAAFGVVAVFAGVPVLFSGGLVTSNNAGLAVPDWPTSFNANMFLYPLAKMTGGIYYEHAHRLFGGLIGLTVLVFCTSCWAWKTPRRVSVGATIGLGLVIFQGILGGIRVTGAADDPDEVAAMTTKTIDQVPEHVSTAYAVTSDNPISLLGAIVHGVLGQLTVAFLCVVAALACARFARDHAHPIARLRDPFLRKATVLMKAALLIQLTLGAVTRHMESAHGAWTHTGFAFVALLAVGIAAARAGLHKGTPLPRIGAWASGVLGVQMLLGFATLVLVLGTYDRDATAGTQAAIQEVDPWYTALTATAHQATGAALLCLCSVLLVWAWRCTTNDPNAPQARAEEADNESPAGAIPIPD